MKWMSKVTTFFQLLNYTSRLLRKEGVDIHTNLIIAQVDSLPYLSAIIQEAVRLHPGVMARQVRISPELPITYHDTESGKQYVLPPGTVTSMSPLDTHLNPSAFGEDAYEFRPQRWIANPKLNRYFHGFARGARNCVG
jgi:cytochrome P450